MTLPPILSGVLALAALSACSAPQPVGPLSLGPAEQRWPAGNPALHGVVKSTGTDSIILPNTENPATLAKDAENGTR